MIEDLVASAVNQAVAKGKQLHADAMKGMTEGLSIPGLQDMLGKLTESDPSEPAPGGTT